MTKYLEPYIERRYFHAAPAPLSRKLAAQEICDYISLPRCFDKVRLSAFYCACNELLENPESERIALYLPFGILAMAPTSFQNAYRNAWYNLLHAQDVRENFHFGDCFEVDARPAEGLERVVKAAHLTPWLIKNGLLSPYELLCIIRDAKARDDVVLLQSFKDTFGFIEEHNWVLARARFDQVRRYLSSLPPRQKQEPLYVSEKRQAWLAQSENPFQPLSPKAQLAGPFSQNLAASKERLEKIERSIKMDDIVLVGGSSLKGYAGVNSDFDIWHLDELKADEALAPGKPEAAHIYFNCVWLGGKNAARHLPSLQKEIATKYTKLPEQERRRTLERLESDLLQYRLLHKGYANFRSWKAGDVPPEMDGDCPFYDDGYRKIATMLFVKYVWL